jgi:hypothetical protein
MNPHSAGNDEERYPHQWVVVAEDRAFSSVPDLTSASITSYLNSGAAMVGMDFEGQLPTQSALQVQIGR